MSKKRIEWLDILRGLGMYLVVIAHTMNGNGEPLLVKYIYSFHMPLFFMISGGAYYLQMNSRKIKFKEMIEHKVETLIWPYVTLNLIVFVWKTFGGMILNIGTVKPVRLLLGILYSNEKRVGAPSNALWFLPTLFLTICCFYLLDELCRGNENKLILVVGVIGGIGYVNSLSAVKMYLPWHIDVVPVALVLFLLGYLFVKYWSLIETFLKNDIIQIIIGVVCFLVAFYCATLNVRVGMSVNRYGSFVLFLGAAVGFSFVCVLIAMKLSGSFVLKYVGRNTLVILGFHAPIYRALESCSEVTNTFFVQHPIFVGTVVFFALIPITWIIENYFPFILKPRRKWKTKSKIGEK